MTFTVGQLVVVKMNSGTKLSIVVPPLAQDPVRVCTWNDSARRWQRPRQMWATTVVDRHPLDARARRGADQLMQLRALVPAACFEWIMRARYPQVSFDYKGPPMVVAPSIGTLLRLADGGVWEVASPIDGHHRLDLVGYDERPTMYLRSGRTIREHVSQLAGAVEITDV